MGSLFCRAGSRPESRFNGEDCHPGWRRFAFDGLPSLGSLGEVARLNEQELRTAVALELSDDRMRAILRPLLPRPPRGLNATALHRFLTSSGIQHGIEKDTLKAVLSAWKLHETGPWIVAEGTPPKAGRSSGLDRLAPPPRSGLDDVEMLPLYVKRDDRIFRSVGSRAPSPGRDVLGVLVPPPQAPDAASLTPGRGISIEEDGTWVARATGFLDVDDGEVRILKTLVHTRGLGPGTYRWPGDARIVGDIAAGTTIEVGGHLSIEGMVGIGAHLRADGDLRVEGVVTGGGTTRLEAEGRMKLTTAIGALITAGGDIVVTELLEGCRTRTRGGLHADGEGCEIIGGTVEAIGGAELNDVKPDGAHHASISVGRASWINDEMRSVEAEIRRWVLYHGKLFNDFRAEHKKYADNRSTLWQVSEKERDQFYLAEDQVHAEQQRVDQRVSRLRSRLEALAASRTYDPKAVVHIRGAVEAGTKISVRGRRYNSGRKVLTKVAVGIFGEGRRVCAVPSAIYLSSEMH